jgi:hypothetical protein
MDLGQGNKRLMPDMYTYSGKYDNITALRVFLHFSEDFARFLEG